MELGGLGYLTIYTTNQLTVVEKEDIRGVRLRKFNLRKIILGVRMHFRHTTTVSNHQSTPATANVFDRLQVGWWVLTSLSTQLGYAMHRLE